jgi:predicted RNA-binding protein YlxR (DUF448 family)
MGRKKHKPQRTCIACRQVKDKRELIRVVRTPAGEIIIDPTGKANGRGAYLCRNANCWDKGLQKGHLAKALKVALSQEAITDLRAELLKV